MRLGVKREGRGESVTVERPLQKLYPLEVSSEGEEAVRDPEPADRGSAGPGALDGETSSGRQDGGPNLTSTNRNALLLGTVIFFATTRSKFKRF